MANLTILRSYATSDPAKLPPSILFKQTAKNITIFDAYPKSMFHFLLLPKVQEPDLPASTLDNLGSLMRKADRETVKKVVSSLAEDAKAVKREIEEEMVQRYGFQWGVWVGFHGAPSMHHLHLHVLSADLCSEKLKNKKHYNSFHPKLGFFLHVDDVLSWFDAEPEYYSNLVKDFKPSKYEPILKEPLQCFHCNTEMKNMPTLKDHLQVEWDKLEKRGKESANRKRKLDALKASQKSSQGTDEEAEAGPERKSDSDGSSSSKKAKSTKEDS